MNIVDAKLEPLDGKYYVTSVVVCIADDEGHQHMVSIDVYGGNWNPSKRELDRGWEPDYGMDHVESEGTLFVVNKILEALE